MFPLNSNMSYIKDNGERDKLGNVIGSGGGSELPSHSVSDAGKVLTVGEDGSLEWDIKGAGGGFYVDKLRPVFIPISGETTYKLGCTTFPIDSTSNPSSYTTPSTPYTLTQLVDFETFGVLELFDNVTSAAITELELEELANTGAVESITLEKPITDYDVIALTGKYDSSDTSAYNTTLFYNDVKLNTPYWFGMKDRNATYSGTITFTSATTAKLSASRRIRILGMNL